MSNGEIPKGHQDTRVKIEPALDFSWITDKGLTGFDTRFNTSGKEQREMISPLGGGIGGTYGLKEFQEGLDQITKDGENRFLLPYIGEEKEDGTPRNIIILRYSSKQIEQFKTAIVEHQEQTSTSEDALL